MSIFFQAVGLLGAGLVLLAYFLLEHDDVDLHHMPYYWLNLIGSLLLMLSLLYYWNLPAFVLESAWACITLYGMIKNVEHPFRRRARPKAASEERSE